MTSTTPTVRELAHRRNDGLDIRLLWDSETDRVAVALALRLRPQNNSKVMSFRIACLPSDGRTVSSERPSFGVRATRARPP